MIVTGGLVELSHGGGEATLQCAGRVCYGFRAVPMELRIGENVQESKERHNNGRISTVQR